MAVKTRTGQSRSSRVGTSVSKTPVKGGSIFRDTKTGKFVEVVGPQGSSRTSKRSVEAIGEASSRRRAALKRLADR